MTTTTKSTPPVALVTGGSSGLGRALVESLDAAGWRVITDGRSAERLETAHTGTAVRRVPGDIADPAHRAALVEAVAEPTVPGLDLLVHNASSLGPLPMAPLVDADAAALRATLETNAVAPHLLSVALVDHLRARDGIVVAITSDAAMEHYETWGLYAAGKVALEHLTLTLGAETGLSAYAVDPGDMRTPMHQDAFPDEDISDRPLPASVVPHLRALIEQRPASGRYRAVDVAIADAGRDGRGAA